MADKHTAREILRQCHVNTDDDFHRLSSSQVEALLAFADDYGYRKPKNANGSRGRYWCAYLQRCAQKNDS